MHPTLLFLFSSSIHLPTFPLPSLTSYLSLVPTELLSAEVVTGETGIEDYLIEAHQQVSVSLVAADVTVDVHGIHDETIQFLGVQMSNANPVMV